MDPQTAILADLFPDGVDQDRPTRNAAPRRVIEDLHFDENTKKYEWTVKEEYFDDAGAQSCEDAFRPMDMRWQFQIEPDLEPAREARRLTVIECMKSRGADVDSDVSYRDLTRRGLSESPECVDKAFQI